MYIEPPHTAWDKEKLQSMINVLKSGKSLPPILVSENQAYSGSHRIEAWLHMDMEIDYVEITHDQCKQVFESMNLDMETDVICDFEPFLEEAIYLGFAENAR